MNNPIIKALRLLAFFPIVLFVFGLLNWTFIKLFLWFTDLSVLWFLLAFLFLFGAVFYVFNWVATLLISISTFIVPFKWVGPITISAIAVINGIILIIAAWSGHHAFWETVKAIAFTIMTIQFTLILITGSVMAQSMKDEN